MNECKLFKKDLEEMNNVHMFVYEVFECVESHRKVGIVAQSISP